MRTPDELVAFAEYPPEPEAAAAARRFVRDTLRSWGVTDQGADADRLVDDAVLLTSELVTNAVVHAGTPFDVTCRLASGRLLEVAVRDRHPVRTLPDPPGALAAATERGRGLLLPTVLASSWGVTYARTAKIVWFRMWLGGDREQPDPVGPVVAVHGAGDDRSDHPAVDAGPTTIPALSTTGPATRTAPDASMRHVAPTGSGGHRQPVARAGKVDAGRRGAVEPSDAAAGEERAARRHRFTGPRDDLGALGYDELLRHTVETARDAVAADAAYALVADEDGELRVRAATGVGVPEQLPAPPGAPVFADAGSARSLVTVPFLVDGRVTGVLGVVSAAPDRFDTEDAATLQRVADRVAIHVERARLSELERARRGRIGFLAEASELLASTLDQRKTVSLIAQLIVPRLATWCAVLLADETGAVRPAYVWHADEARIDALGALLTAAPPPEAPAAGDTWSPAVPPQVRLSPNAAELTGDAAWCFPLVARGRSLGTVVIGRPRGDRLPKDALELTEDLARRAALALDNARLYRQQQLTSQALQRSLLPPELPEIPGVDLAVAHEVAGEGNEVGGDFYDVFAAGEGRWRFAIGDVCGTGPEAAAVTGLARHTLRILAREGHDVAEVVGRLNELILDDTAGSRFITLLHGEIVVTPRDPTGVAAASRDDAPPGPLVQVSLVCAGHPPPLLLPAGDAATPPHPVAEPQPLLGVVNGLSFHTDTVDLHPGDLLLCVTDGITERRSGNRLLDDDDGLAALLAECRGLTAGAVAARIQRAADEFGTDPPSDDMALLVLRAG